MHGSIFSLLGVLLLLIGSVNAFTPLSVSRQSSGPPKKVYSGGRSSSTSRATTRLFGAAAMQVTGEELEKMLTEMDQPIVVDAFATWCGPCLVMSPIFEQAAEELKGKVRFVKLDTDEEEIMAARLNIMGLPTLLFLDEFKPEEGGDEPEAAVVLKGRIEGAIKKESILKLCDHYFFDGPAPEQL